MAARLVLAPEVEQDISDAFEWYEFRETGLGDEFMRCIVASIQSILRNSESRRSVYADYRRALVRRFPFSVFYNFSGSTVTVYCVIHNARDPEKWRQRLR